MKILKVEAFSNRINEIKQSKDVSLMEAILIYVEEEGIEPSQLKRLFPRQMIDELEIEANSKNLLKK